jgi:acyl carrier protein
MTIAQSVRTFLTNEVTLLKHSEEVDEHASLIESGLLDSIDQIKLVSFLEQSFDIAIEAEDLSAGHLESISAIERFVRARTSA